MKNVGINTVGAIFFMLLALFYLFEGRDLSLTAEFGPGAGFFPLVLGITLFILSTVWLVQGIKDRTDASWKKIIPALKPVLLFVGCVVFCLFVPNLGTVVALFALLYCIWFFEKISWWLNLILSLSVSLGLYAIFKIGLEVSLPQGLFWF